MSAAGGARKVHPIINEGRMAHFTLCLSVRIWKNRTVDLMASIQAAVWLAGPCVNVQVSCYTVVCAHRYESRECTLPIDDSFVFAALIFDDTRAGEARFCARQSGLIGRLARKVQWKFVIKTGVSSPKESPGTFQLLSAICRPRILICSNHRP